MTRQLAPVALTDRYTVQRGRVHLTGIQALARLPFDLRRADMRAGRGTAAFISGYEGSPLAGYDTELARNTTLLDEHDIVFQPGVNEELAASAVQGTQLAAMQPDKRVDGVTGIWYGKSPGLDRATDAIRHGNLMGTHPQGGVLALVGDDPAAKSSTMPGASEMVLADLGLPILYPSDPQEALDFGLHGVAMSRACGLWVAMKIVTNVADGSGTVEIDPDRVNPVVPDLSVDGREYRHEVTARVLQPTLGVLERSREGARLEIARRYAAANGLNRITHSGPDDRVGIIAAGKTFLDVRQALRMLGLEGDELSRRGVRLLQLGMIHPLEPTVVERFAAGLTEIIVVEEKRPLIETAVKDLLYGRVDAPAVIGKRASGGQAFLPVDGELDPDIVAARLAARLSGIGAFPTVDIWLESARPRRTQIALPLVTRTPYFCSGCPHNVSTKTPEGSLVGAGIGCHTMVSLMGTDQVGDVTGMMQMGGEGTQWIGMAPFLDRKHLIQNLGDGTFHHSGSLAIRAAIAAGIDITYKLLYNSAVAMTGGQQAVGVMSVPAICTTMTAEGVSRIIITTDDPKAYRKVRLPNGVQVWHRDRLIEAQESLSREKGVTLLIHDQECATELRRKRKRGLAPEPTQRVLINERVCEGCGDCGQKSNCLSVQPVATEFGRKTQIDQSSCNKDYSCLAGDCPSFITVVPAGKRASRVSAPRVASDALPDPVVTLDRSHTTRIAGVGGSGVVTLTQILSAAASLAGRHVRALDQTGLAQKGGAVVSDIKITAEPIDQASKATAHECDLYLGCDLLVAADSTYLVAADPARTVAVVSTSEVPTGQMIVDTAVTFPEVGPITDALRATTRNAFFLDARHAANALLGEDQFANLLLAGAAVQCGALPLPAAAVEEAITLNGVKVDANVTAFRYGRLAVADPAAFAAALDAQQVVAKPPRTISEQARELIAEVNTESGSALHHLLTIRIPDLVDYQNVSYARQYGRFVEHVRRTEAERMPGSTAVTEVVARYLYKLMAYKDEYEVARLSLDPAVRAAVELQFGPGARMAYRLHPPILRALGRKEKIELGPWFRPVYRVLVALRRVRGTPMDPFGVGTVRRIERELITEYRSIIEHLLAGLRSDNHALAVEIAALPDLVRGYESIKLANVALYRAKASELMAEFDGAPTRLSIA
ncbi:indolepyruvate ferredoxin oxidoreductase family protein [Rhodococcus opacus]|uniref:Indolepyruvate ferredoxin oxidoreductase family protein n=1 Tax=Rhodococcus opacus TaxID=37919 RepID=A0AAX3YTI9_RHOOP|nr:indolepyruvate ferredoxin oxidoreductase family protein [Rhodococcus opacus]MCZ4587620.1 indolepyruvate ferredoxin oxidoreductase family protein [Rhodococcus opacus]WLF51384.1 indolepyruvate ferredoxin oxidoreductase family protein [Rhodococcus opacus]